MRVRTILAEAKSPIEAVTDNMASAIKSRRMRDGKVSVSALKGVLAEAKVWTEAYIKQARNQGKDVSGLRTAMDEAIVKVYESHIKQAVDITNYKKGAGA